MELSDYVERFESLMLQNERNLRRFQLHNKKMAKLVTSGMSPDDARAQVLQERRECAQFDTQLLDKGSDSIETMRKIVTDLFHEMAGVDMEESEALNAWTDHMMDEIEQGEDAKLVKKLVADGTEQTVAEERVASARKAMCEKLAQHKIDLIAMYEKTQSTEEATASATATQLHQRRVVHESHKRNFLLLKQGADPERDVDIFHPMISISELEHHHACLERHASEQANEPANKPANEPANEPAMRL